MQNITIPQLISKYEKIPGGLMPLLHAIQDELGYIPNDVVPNIALGLNLSRAEVHGVITYYHFFRTTPPGKHVGIAQPESVALDVIVPARGGRYPWTSGPLPVPAPALAR
jgi:formate dehydrogenase subunit gamma